MTNMLALALLILSLVACDKQPVVVSQPDQSTVQVSPQPLDVILHRDDSTRVRDVGFNETVTIALDEDNAAKTKWAVASNWGMKLVDETKKDVGNNFTRRVFRFRFVNTGNTSVTLALLNPWKHDGMIQDQVKYVFNVH